ncbi:hypothetical protein FPSE_11166 [Fusarium pseudograminearum CS3096]|uniref:Protein kinase domain-containing protein n=1 Tax=Fusarium pseudograminearum (strain CS3096) TaxID=1028729 RepID=K3VXC4_FUSPC|nr:hypothetical protein FPSE_11166 [Fusarium pseudograminearum CS3096]EKJ68655.1 hypothetical protein FPSE_11166 [Fusarium pseudograminearum CS3096]
MYAFKKKSIDESISELEKWQSTFDISWLLILKVANQTLATGDQMIATQERLPNVTEGLISQSHPKPEADRAVFLRPDGIDMSTASLITFCEARHFTKGSESLILDSLTCSSTSKISRSLVVKDVKSLAQKLYAHQDPGYGLFKCKGVLKRDTRDQNEDQLNFTLVFKVPRYLLEPRSMRKMLLRAECPNSLSEVVRIGQELAKAVSYIHLLDFVHKKICPESILLLRHIEKDYLAAYLVGFQKFRKDGGMTSLLGSSDWPQMLYCHPKRYGQRPEDAYIMQHDIYSLGVCLLEIGLWESLVRYGESGQLVPSQLIKDYLPSSGMGSIESLKQHLVMLARTRLPRRIGSKYAEIVETCLTCLDDGNADFGDESEFLDADGVLVGVRYIEKLR